MKPAMKLIDDEEVPVANLVLLGSVTILLALLVLLPRILRIPLMIFLIAIGYGPDIWTGIIITVLAGTLYGLTYDDKKSDRSVLLFVCVLLAIGSTSMFMKVPPELVYWVIAGLVAVALIYMLPHVGNHADDQGLRYVSWFLMAVGISCVGLAMTHTDDRSPILSIMAAARCGSGWDVDAETYKGCLNEFIEDRSAALYDLGYLSDEDLLKKRAARFKRLPKVEEVRQLAAESGATDWYTWIPVVAAVVSPTEKPETIWNYIVEFVRYVRAFQWIVAWCVKLTAAAVLAMALSSTALIAYVRRIRALEDARVGLAAVRHDVIVNAEALFESLKITPWRVFFESLWWNSDKVMFFSIGIALAAGSFTTTVFGAIPVVLGTGCGFLTFLKIASLSRLVEAGRFRDTKGLRDYALFTNKEMGECKKMLVSFIRTLVCIAIGAQILSGGVSFMMIPIAVVSLNYAVKKDTPLSVCMAVFSTAAMAFESYTMMIMPIGIFIANSYGYSDLNQFGDVDPLEPLPRNEGDL